MRANGDIDYSIHFLEPLNLLIAHMRYIGNDYEGDMAEIGKSEHTKKWWKVSPCSEHLTYPTWELEPRPMPTRCVGDPSMRCPSWRLTHPRLMLGYNADHLDDGWDARELCPRSDRQRERTWMVDKL